MKENHSINPLSMEKRISENYKSIEELKHGGTGGGVELTQLFDTWEENKNYSTDNVVTYENKIYRAKSASKAHTFDSSDWEEITISKALYYGYLYNNDKSEINNKITQLVNSLFEGHYYDSSETYNKNDVVVFKDYNHYYIFKSKIDNNTTHPYYEYNPDNWVQSDDLIDLILTSSGGSSGGNITEYEVNFNNNAWEGGSGNEYTFSNEIFSPDLTSGSKVRIIINFEEFSPNNGLKVRLNNLGLQNIFKLDGVFTVERNKNDFDYCLYNYQISNLVLTDDYSKEMFYTQPLVFPTALKFKGADGESYITLGGRYFNRLTGTLTNAKIILDFEIL